MEDIVNQDTKQQKWVTRITQWQQSGKSTKAWCQEKQVVYTTFLGWRGRLQLNPSPLIQSTTPSSSQFIELKERPSINISSGVSVECSGVLIHLSVEFNSSTLKKCLDALCGGTC
jgi:hypothetical protein